MEGRSAAVRWFVLAMTAVALLVVLTQLDRILIELGYPEPDGGGMAALHKADSVGSWGPAAIEAAGIQGNPLAIAVVYLVLDVLLIAVYTILLVLSALGLKSQLQAGDRWRKPLELVLNGTLAFTIGLALVDLLEDVVQALTRIPELVLFRRLSRSS